MNISNGLLQNLLKICRLLSSHKVSFCLAGGLAVSILTRPRATEDIDLLLVATDEDKVKIITLLKNNFTVIENKKDNLKIGCLKLWRVVIKDLDNENGFYILDFILADTSFLENIVNRAVDFEIHEITIPIIRPEDLIIIKMHSDRTQDKLDVETMMHELEDELDSDYINNNKDKI